MSLHLERQSKSVALCRSTWILSPRLGRRSLMVIIPRQVERHILNQRLSDSWKSTFSVARERARVGLAAATQDWARRTNRMRDSDQENQDAGH